MGVAGTLFAVGELFVLFGLKTNKDQFKDATLALNKLKAAIVATGAISLAHDFVDLAQSTAKSAVHVLGMSSALGLSTKTIQQYSFVAEQAGSDINQFSVGISMFERNLKEFAAGRGSKRFNEAMQAIGLSNTDAKNALVGPDGINSAIFKIADAYLKMGNSATRAAINTALFGQRARGMAQDLGKGSAALKELFAKLDALGGIISEEKLQKLKKLDNSINDIKIAFAGVTGEIIGALSPSLSEALEGIAKWIQENKKQIDFILTFAFNVIIDVFKLMMQVANLFTAAISGNRVALAVLISIGVILEAFVLPALIKVALAGWAAVAPLLLPAIIVGLISLAVLELIDHWEDLTDLLSDVWDFIQRQARRFWDWLLDILKTTGDKIQGLFHDALSGAAGILHSIAGVALGIRDWAVGLWDDFWSLVDRVLSFFSERIDWIKREAADIANLIPGVDVHWGHDQQGQPVKPDETADENKARPRTFGKDVANVVLQAQQQPAQTLREVLDPIAENVLGRPGNANAVTVNAPAGSAVALAANARPQGPTSVSVGPTTINITGVKDATEAKEHIADSIDGVHRHAAAALGGEVQ